MSTKVILTRGIPGSGKSTWAKAWVKQSPSTRGRVNRDDIRMTMFGVPHGVDEKTVTRVQNAMIRALIAAGKDVVVDNTNLNPIYANRLASFVTSLGAQVEYREFEIDVETAILRDAQRADPVGAEVVRSFYQTYRASTDGQ